MPATKARAAALPLRTALLVLLAAPLLCSCAGRNGPARGGTSTAAVRTAGVQYPGRALEGNTKAPRGADPADGWDREENGGLKRDWPMGLFILLIGAAAGAL